MADLVEDLVLLQKIHTLVMVMLEAIHHQKVVMVDLLTLIVYLAAVVELAVQVVQGRDLALEVAVVT
jgi:hypothetical protein